MGLWLRSWALATVLCSLTLHCTGDPQNVTGLLSSDVKRENSYTEPSAELTASLGEEEARKSPYGGEDSSFLDNKSQSVTKGKKSQKKTLTQSLESSVHPTGQAIGFPDAESTSTYRSTGLKQENESRSCVGCGGDTYSNGKPPARSLLSERNGMSVETVTSLVWPVGQGTNDSELKNRLIKGDRPSVTESQEDSGSGDAHVKVAPGQVTRSGSSETQWNLRDFMGMATATPFQASVTKGNTLLNPSTEKAISPDSAEIDHLLQVSRETSLQSPSPSGTEPLSQGPDKPRKEVNFEAGKSQGPFTILEKMSGQSTAQGAQGSTDITMVTENTQTDSLYTSVPPDGPLKPSEPPSDTDIDYNDPSDIDEHWGFPHFPDPSSIGSDSTKSIHDKLAPWHKPLNYDDFLPFDDSYFFPTHSSYADGYEEGGIEDDEDDEDLDEAEDLDDGDIPSNVVWNVARAATLTPNIQTGTVDEKSTVRQGVLSRGELTPKFQPDVHKDHIQTMSGTSENGTECRNGYVRRNNSCRSLCDIYPTYCYNGGQCYIVENTGVFCRCNTQDYIWHKGLRCESIITDFQVMCVAVGTAALVVLLLFMMTVFFAKKLYLLKTENYKLRKRNRYRTPSELHNDNFSLSTIAEGSHPNVRKLCDTPCNLSPHARALAYYDNVICQEDPNAPQKVQDLPKACLKDEEPFNIQNSLSPKHESGKGDADIADVNCVLNNLT